MKESSDSLLNETSTDYRSGERLDLPDWCGHLSHRSNVPIDEWLAYCRSNLPALRARPGYAERRLQNGIPVEFSL